AGGMPLPPAWGWKLPGAGRAAHVAAAAEFQATTVQACGLFPFIAGAGSPVIGTPVGRHQLDGTVVCLDPLGWLRAGLTTNPGMMMLGQPGSGKALDVATPVPVPAGWAAMGDLRPGDLVFDEHGQPVPIIAVSEVLADRPCLEVTFDDSTTITADAGHQWVTAGPGSGRPGPGTRIRTTQQIMDTLHGPGGRPAHSIAVAGPLQLPGTYLPVPPYLLGAWLAGAARGTPGGDLTARPAVLRDRLAGLGLLDGEPHIPMAYLRASRQQRRDLLSGLLETGGRLPSRGVAAWATPQARLARDVRELACSLGHRPILAAPPPGLRAEPGDWTVIITSRQARPGIPGRKVTGVRPVPSRPVRCIQAGSASGLFLAGESMIPTHNSTLVKRLAVGAVARGDTVLVLGDPRPDYAGLADYLGGQVIRVGRGVDRLNPLDAGPLGAVLPRLPAAEAARLRSEVRARRLSLLMALCTLIRGRILGNAEEVILGRAVDLLDDRAAGGAQPAVPDVLRVIEEGPDELRAAARAADPDRYRAQVADLAFTLDLLLSGTLAGVFDGPTTTAIDLSAPMVTVDISRAGGAGDKLLTAAMLCTWAYGFAVADAGAVLAELGIAPRRSYMAINDELWRALRGAPGLVEHADALTRLNRAKGMASVMITHSLADLDALPTEEDRAKARGFLERSAITVLAALPPRELAMVSQVTPLTGPEAELVASWSAPESWRPGTRHPGRGKYLIKTGGRLGIPFSASLVAAERDLYDTDQAIRGATGRTAS
ncbi:MAG: hypothetical protein ACRDRJ_24045, partial [Streptosporangiaceae bacterium]